VVSKKNICVSYKEHKTNDQVLCEANTYRKLLNKIKAVQIRRSCEGMENLVTSGKYSRKKRQSRTKRKDP
jgi:hypothetical protein